MKKTTLSSGLTEVQKESILRLAASIRGQKGGTTITPRKARSSAKNGKLGGRPRKAVAA